MSQKIGNVLKEMIKEKNMTIFSLAKEVGVDRSTLQHFLSGKRRLNLEDLQKIMVALNLSKDKKKILYALYENEYDDCEVLKNCHDIFVLYNEISAQANQKKMLIETEEYLVKTQLASEKARIIKGQVKIEGIIRSCFMEEMGRNEDAHVIMSINFKHYFLYELIMRISCHNHRCGKIQNIIPLVNKKKLGNNLDILKTVLLLKSLPNVDYEPYYFYSGTKIYDDISIIVPNYFITSKQVITIDRDFESAIIYEDPEILDYYQKKSQMILRKCMPFVEKESVQWINCTLPVFEKVKNSTISEKFIAYDQLEMILDKNANPEEKVSTTIAPLETGITQQSNISVLRDGLVGTAKNLCIRYSINEETVEFILLNEMNQNIQKLIVKEIGIVIIFRDFLNYLPHSVHVCSPEEIKNSLRNIHYIGSGIKTV
ncbi:helix-turn-helix transcriptional regulator [Acetobacterium wieringae]|uniref:helix-turn-helix transcriptional regulator n=1 Tax=Acetobacterium wieringae TaxID=52694 RepID=UPI0026EF1E59|nr:helix-turn-helix transcriptional regulator [Acetobacterium wieringae]